MRPLSSSILLLPKRPLYSCSNSAVKSAATAGESIITKLLEFMMRSDSVQLAVPQKTKRPSTTMNLLCMMWGMLPIDMGTWRSRRAS